MVEDKTKRKLPFLKLGNRKNLDDWYPKEIACCAKLVSACSEGYDDEVRRLLLLGVPPCTDMKGNTPMHLAATPEIAKLLIEAGADVNVEGADGVMPVHVAAFQGNLGVLLVLLENGADVNAMGRSGERPLHLAVHMFGAPIKGADYMGVVKLLVEKGADVNATDKSGEPPISCARNKKLADFLRKKGANGLKQGSKESFVEWLEMKGKEKGMKLSIIKVEGMQLEFEGERSDVKEGSSSKRVGE